MFEMMEALEEKITVGKSMKTRKSRSVRTAGRWKVVVGDNEYFIEQVTKEVVLDELKAIREDMRKRRLVTESDGDFIDKYLDVDIMNSLNYPQLFGRLSMDKKLRERIYNLYLYAGAGLVAKDLRNNYFLALYEGVNGRVPLNCMGSEGTYYLNSELKETLLENDENLKVHESVLTAIKTKSRKRRRTDRNSEGSSEENFEENSEGNSDGTIKRKSRKRQRTAKNSEGSSEGNSDGINN
uniref:ARID domain-containing protein n=1 Tax=Strongyloides papillosus TaxID=174720 RepID=A0A0N5B952_STREA